MAPIEPVGDAEHPAQPPHDGALFGRQLRVVVVLPARSGFPVVAADQRDEQAVARGEVEPLRVHDELKAVVVVAPVADELAHVVDECGRFQEQPLLRVAAEHRGELVEEQKAQVPHLLDVPAIRLAPLRELPHEPERVPAAVGVGARHLEEQAVPEAEGAHRERSRIEEREQLGGDGEPREDDVGALRAQPRDRTPLLRGFRGEPLEEMLDLGRSDLDAVNRLGNRRATPRDGHARQGRERAAGSDEARSPPAARGQPLAKLLPDLGPELADPTDGIRGVIEVQLGEPDGAERE